MSSEKRDELIGLLQFHEQAVANIRFVLELMQAGQGNGSRPEPPPMVVPGPPRRTIAPRGQGKIHRQRQTTADMLSDFDPKTPRTAEELTFNPRRLGVLVQRGYLKKKKGGYIRTEKPFTV